MKIEEYVKENENNIINTISDLISFKSVSTETGNKEEPFGEECKKALDYALELGKKMGFRTQNVDGYCRVYRIWRRRRNGWNYWTFRCSSSTF